MALTDNPEHMSFDQYLGLRKRIKNTFGMIDQNKRTQQLLMGAFTEQIENVHQKNASIGRTYQARVRTRIRDRMQTEEQDREFNVKYISSMLPSALEMHKFMRFMNKDKIFESKSGHRIVSNIRTYKDKERL